MNVQKIEEKYAKPKRHYAHRNSTESIRFKLIVILLKSHFLFQLCVALFQQINFDHLTNNFLWRGDKGGTASSIPVHSVPTFSVCVSPFMLVYYSY